MNNSNNTDETHHDEADTKLFNLQNTDNNRCGVFFGKSKTDAVSTAATFWDTKYDNITETKI